MDEISRILTGIRSGRPGAQDALVAALYDALHGAARRQLAGERAGHTLQPTALVNEAWMKVVPHAGHYADREQFLAAAATAIRRVLIDHARRRAAERRGGGRLRVALDAIEPAAEIPDEDVLAVDEALVELTTFAPDQARIVELRFFAGLEYAAIASLLAISESTVERRWRLARAWLRSRLEPDDGC